MNVILKVGLVLLKLYEKRLLDMKIDEILVFFNDLSKSELFINTQYFAIKEGKISIEDASEEYDIIENLSKSLKETPLPQTILDQLDREYVLFEIIIIEALNKMHASK